MIYQHKKRSPIKVISTKIIGLYFICTVFSFKPFAQQLKVAGESKPSARFGIRAGINLSTLYVDNVKDKNIKLGGIGGFFAKIPVAKNVSIQPEVLYSMKGAQLNYNSILGSGKYRYNLDYIEVPLTAVVNIAKNFSIVAGGYAGFLTSVKVKDVDETGNVNGITALNKDNFESFDYGLTGGIGFDIEKINLAFRYSYGLKNVGKDGVAGIFLQNSKHSVIALTLGFAL